MMSGIRHLLKRVVSKITHKVRKCPRANYQTNNIHLRALTAIAKLDMSPE